MVWLTDERRLTLFPTETIVRDSHHRKYPTRRDQDLNLRRTTTSRRQNSYNVKFLKIYKTPLAQKSFLCFLCFFLFFFIVCFLITLFSDHSKNWKIIALGEGRKYGVIHFGRTQNFQKILLVF